MHLRMQTCVLVFVRSGAETNWQVGLVRKQVGSVLHRLQVAAKRSLQPVARAVRLIPFDRCESLSHSRHWLDRPCTVRTAVCV